MDENINYKYMAVKDYMKSKVRSDFYDKSIEEEKVFGPRSDDYGRKKNVFKNCPAHAEASGAKERKSGERSTNIRIDEYCTYLSKFLRKKNDDYGDSLQNPNAIFQKNKMDGILARLDDKLGRIKSVGINDKTEDTIEDLIGYLIHLKIMMNK